MKHMDFIITIDTADTYQAGALRLPVWLMLIHYSDRCWGACSDIDTPWYPSIKIFRQSAYASWNSVARQLDDAFAEWVDEALGQA